jgi:hypothetical protein
MKSTLYILSFLFLCTLSIHAQTLRLDQVPPAVTNAFRARYPQAQQPSWELNGSDTYQVGFFSAKKMQTAVFDNMGKWVRTETDITIGPVPRAVSNAISKNFPGYNVQIITELENADATITYEVVVFKGRENYDVIFSAKGIILKKEAGRTE